MFSSRPTLLPGNFLPVPFKETERVTFIPALKAYIVSAFAEDPDQYMDDLRLLDSLRAEVVKPNLHDESIQQHLRYYGQLRTISSKFIMDDDHIRIAFSWASALDKDRRYTTSYNVGFEKASVLFNLAALYSSLASNMTLDSEAAYKRAAMLFQQAAGAFAAIVDNLAAWNISTSSSVQLNALSQLMLAHAQEVFFEKAQSGNMKVGTLAKLAAQVAVFYETASEGASQTQVFDKSWIAYMNIKLSYWKAVATCNKSLEAHAADKYGEQIAWLQAAAAHSRAANDSSQLKNVTIAKVHSDVKTLQATIDRALLQANKDNDLIYMAIVPKIETLPVIAPARMVNPVPLPDSAGLSAIMGRALFQHLVPFEVHQLASEYASIKDQIAKEASDKLTEATSVAFRQATPTLASINLPGAIEALEQPIGLPQSVLQRSEEIRAQGGFEGLESSWQTLQAMSSKCWTILREAMEKLDTEAAEDQSMQMQFGDKWNRASSVSLGQNLRDSERRFREKLQEADNANRVVRSKMDRDSHLIVHICLSRQELEASVPASTAGSTLVLKDQNLKQLKGLLDQLNTNFKKRNALIERIKAAAASDDIAPRLLEELDGNASAASLDKKAIFDSQLKMYDALKTEVADLLSQQEQLLPAIVESNKKFVESRQTSELIRQRENALQSLDNGYKAFKDISANMQEGIKFFSDIETTLVKFSDNCRDFVLARDIEKKDMLQQIQMNVARLRVSDSPAPASSSPSSTPAPASAPVGGVWPGGGAVQYPQMPQGHFVFVPASTGTWQQGQPLQYVQPGYGSSPIPGAYPGVYTLAQAPPSQGTGRPRQ
nr:Rhophilin, Rho GTPase binding protein [Polyrhizophydium stewartii]